MNKAVFLDRDGTINIDTGFIDNPKDIIFIKGIKDALKRLQTKGFKLYIISNQSGVGRGYFSEDQLNQVNRKVADELANAGIKIEGISCCIHHPDNGCLCRKPSPKMVLDFVKRDNIDLNRSFFIGDRMIDIETGKNAGCKTILLTTGDIFKIDNSEWIDPDYVAEDLMDAVEWILAQTEGDG